MAATALHHHESPAQQAPAWRRELVVLQLRSTRTLTALDRACDSLRALEDEVETFLDDYYAQVGGLVDQLQALERELQQSGKAMYAVPTTDLPPAPLPALDAQVKTLYRKLVRQCHPDTAGEEKADAIRSLNAAYAERNISELWKMQWEMERNEQHLDPDTRVAQLKAHCEQMQQALMTVEKRQQALVSSAGYALMQRAFLLRLGGQDFIASVKAHLSQQIAQAKRELLRAKLYQ